MKKALLIIGILLIAIALNIPAWAKHLHKESYYQAIWCQERGGETEVVMPDGTRCDCLTEDVACEVDFASASKWYESITQALHYAMHTGKQAAILLIVEKPGDWKYVDRAKALIKFYCLPVVVFVIEPEKVD